MPTTKPRVHVVLEPETHRTLARVARYMDTSMSALIGQLVEEATPTLHQLADTLEQAQGLALKLPGTVHGKLAELEQHAQALEHGSQEVLDSIQEQAAEKREQQGSARVRATPQGAARARSGPGDVR